MRWWDYSEHKFNINGRVCLKNSLLFGLLVMVVFYLIQPVIDLILNQITSKVLWYVLFWTLLSVHIIDTIFSTIHHINISKVLSKLENFMEELGDKLEEKTNQFMEYITHTKIAKKLQSLNVHYPSMKIRTKEKKKRLSLKDIVARIKSTDKE